MYKSRFVVFVEGPNVEVFRRIDHGHGRIEYKKVRTAVVPVAKPMIDLGSIWTALVTTAINVIGTALVKTAITVVGSASAS